MTTRLMTVSILVVALGVALAVAQPGKFWRDPGFTKELGLSEEKVAELEQIHKRDRDRMVDLRADLEKKRMALDDAFESKTFDEAKAKAAHDAVVAAESELRKAEFARHLAVRKALTLEQFEKLEAVRHERDRRERIGPPPDAPRPPMPPRPPEPPGPPDMPEPPEPPQPPAR